MDSSVQKSWFDGWEMQSSTKWWIHVNAQYKHDTEEVAQVVWPTLVGDALKDKFTQKWKFSHFPLALKQISVAAFSQTTDLDGDCYKT